MEAMPQFEEQIPYPLAQHMPECLPAGRVGTPAVGLLLLVLSKEHRLERPSVQVEIDDIGGSERPLR
jgi:hypothetical protein